MPKIEIDYSNTIFYKIYCIDPLINELYIGHTTNFVQRKYSHKQGTLNTKSSNYNCKLYNVIRSNKGWDNWKMDIIAFHECDDLLSAKKIEQQYFEEFKATLNSIEPFPKHKPKVINVVIKKEKPILYCDVCNINFNTIKLQETHNKTKKHIKKETMETNIMPQHVEKFYCNKCDFKCSKESNWNIHIKTNKHKMEITGNIKNANHNECELCSKIFKSYSGLWKHKKKCSIIQEEEKPNINDVNLPTHTNINIHETHKLVELLMLKNQEFITELATTLTHSNKDVIKKMMEIMPQIGNNSHNANSYNTTNNQFNIQMFLNEHCKDAMNLTDFIESLPITAETYDHTIENGLTKSITKMMITGLSELDILQRPIHCTDASRKTLYVKDDDTWEKDNELLHLLKGIRDLSFKQRVNIHKWQDENEGWDVKDDLQTKITMLVFHTMTDIDNDEKETRKIISAISKNTYLTNEIKNEYK